MGGANRSKVAAWKVRPFRRRWFPDVIFGSEGDTAQRAGRLHVGWIARPNDLGRLGSVTNPGGVTSALSLRPSACPKIDDFG